VSLVFIYFAVVNFWVDQSLNILGFGKCSYWLHTCSLLVLLLMVLSILNLQIIEFQLLTCVLCIMSIQGARNEIFAMQPAPIQVSYMGFPGTTGATYIDYLVTDEVGREQESKFASLSAVLLFVFVVWILMHLLLPVCFTHPFLAYLFWKAGSPATLLLCEWL